MSVPTTAITSHSNPSYRRLLALHNARGVRREGHALVCGRRIVREVLAESPERVVALVYPLSDVSLASEGSPADGATGGIVHDPTIVPSAWSGTTLSLAPNLFKEADLFGTGAPLAVVKTRPLQGWSAVSPTSGVTLFLPFGDPENLGAALRSAAAFGVDRVVLLEEAAHPYHPRSIRSSAGAALRLELLTGPSVAELIEIAPPNLFALDMAGGDIRSVEAGADFGLVIGEEGKGLPPLGSVPAISIPIDSQVESLNAAVATGIALWALRSDV